MYAANVLEQTHRVTAAAITTVETDPVFMACPFKAACPSSSNSTCNPGYEGVLCGVCRVGYHATHDGSLLSFTFFLLRLRIPLVMHWSNGHDQ